MEEKRTIGKNDEGDIVIKDGVIDVDTDADGE